MPLIEAKPRSISQRHYFGLKNQVITTTEIQTAKKDTIPKFSLPINHWHPVATSNFKIYGSFSGNYPVGINHKVTFTNIQLDNRENGYIQYFPNRKEFQLFPKGIYQIDVHLDLWLNNASLRKLTTFELKLIKFSPYQIQPISSYHLNVIPMFVEILYGETQRYFFPFACVQGSIIIEVTPDDFVYPVFNYQRMLDGTDIDINDSFEAYINFSYIKEVL